MNRKQLLVIATLSAMGTLAFGEDAKPASPNTFTGNTSLVSQYVFRGLAQTNGKPAVQAGYDYAHACGFYAGVWGSNISWFTDQVGYGSGNSAALETDLYLGYKYTFLKDFTLDLGAIEYYYPGTYADTTGKPHTTEAYLGLSYKWASLKYSQALSNDFFGIADAKNTKYIDASANVPLPQGLTLALHAGRQGYSISSETYSYNDYKVGLSKEVLPTYTLGLAYTYANAKDAGYTNAFGKNLGGSRVALTFTKAF